MSKMAHPLAVTVHHQHRPPVQAHHSAPYPANATMCNIRFMVEFISGLICRHTHTMISNIIGSAGEPMARLAPAAYSDGLAQPRRNARNDGERPSVRQISLELFQNPREENPSGVAEMAAYWMYFLASDLANVAPSQCLIKGGVVLFIIGF